MVEVARKMYRVVLVDLVLLVMILHVVTVLVTSRLLEAAASGLREWLDDHRLLLHLLRSGVDDRLAFLQSWRTNMIG